MIAALKTIAPDVAAPVVPAPRRSYGRGAWIGELADEPSEGDQPELATIEAIGEVVTPAEIAKVLEDGFQTTAAKFTAVVANTLRKHRSFKRIGRGECQQLEAEARARQR